MNSSTIVGSRSLDTATQNGICRMCRKIVCNSVFSAVPRGGFKEVCPIPSPTTWNVGSCPLCQLFADHLGDANDTVKRYLYVKSSRENMAWGWNTVETALVYIGDQAKPFFVLQPKGVGIVRLVPPSISFDVIRDWYKFCRAHHTKTCSAEAGTIPTTLIPTFKVIDCESRRIVPGHGLSFIALSYTWGPSDSDPPRFAEDLGEDLPCTIEDAIMSTLGLGFRYLWIDQHCINYGVDGESKDQISKMDVIYSKAELTLIAAAGEDRDYGLPGTPLRPRKVQQPCAEIGNQVLISSMESPTTAIMNSRWSSRGWTYQEALLSRRRLAFTDQQVYFECSGMYCCESINLSISSMHTQDKQRFRSCYRLGDNNNLGIFPGKLGSEQFEIISRLQEYSARVMSRPDDSLNAVRGVLRAMEKGPSKIRHLFGVPVLPRPSVPNGIKRASNLRRGIYETRHWSPCAGFGLGLCWQPTSELTRPNQVSCYPTWSWAGWRMEVAGDQSAGKEETGNQSAGKEATGGQWTGKVQWAFDERMWRNLEGDEDLRVKVKLKDVQGGNVMDLEAFMERYDELKDYAVPTLHISAWVTKVFLQKCGGGVRSDVLSTDGLRRLRWNEDLLLQKPVFQVGEESSSCLGIFVAKAVGGHYGGPGRFVLLVSETESGDYERVGLGMLSANNIEGQKHDDSDDLVCENATPVDLWKDWKHLRLC